MNLIRCVHPNSKVYWAGDYSIFRIDGPIEQFIKDDLRSRYPTAKAVLIQSDGWLHAKEFLDRIPSQPSGPTIVPTIVPTLASRKVSHPFVVMTPLDDETFVSGLILPNKKAWHDKKPIVFWRGGASGEDRPSLRRRVVSALYHHPSADVRISRNGAWEMGQHIPDQFMAEWRPLSDHFNCKYILIVDGRMIASNHQWVFGSGSVPILISHPDNDFWFRRYLLPGVHYVEIAYDLSNLTEKIDWLVEHDDEAQKIAENAMHLAQTIFTPDFQRWHLKGEIDRAISAQATALDLYYQERCTRESDINQHLPTLYRYAAECRTVVECGVRRITSSYAFAAALRATPNNRMIMVDLDRSPDMTRFLAMCHSEGVNATFFEGSDLECPLPEEPVDLLFLDTWHVYGHLRRELTRWHPVVAKYIILHDTTVDEWEGETIRCGLDAEQQSQETGIPVEEIRLGLWPAVEEFLRSHPEWYIERRDVNNNGLTVLKKRS